MKDNQGGLASDRALMNRIVWRIMPLAVACFIISTIDRSNIGFAKLGMLDDLGFSEAIFGFGSSLFYVGYIVLEIPSVMANYKYGARIWFARIMVTWAIATLLFIFVKTPMMFYLLRFAVGAAEAGLYPALIFYMTLWFPPAERSRAMGLLTLGSALGNGLSALLCGSLLELHGVFDLAGWQWVFLVTGLLPIFTAVLVLRYLPSTPADAKFLTEGEKDRVRTLVGSPAHENHGHPLSTMLHPHVIGFGLLYAVLLACLHGVNYWMPTVLRNLGVSGSMNGLIIGVPWVIDAILLVWLMPKLRTANAVTRTLVVLGLLGLVSFGIAAIGGGVGVKAVALLFGIPAISLSIACFWTIPTKYFSGAHGAAAIGSVSMIANLGGFAALNAMPAMADYLGSPTRALWVPSVGLAIIGIWHCACSSCNDAPAQAA